jgi:hypothetical protein
MKTLSSASFFRVFDLMVGTGNPGLKLDRWTIDDVHFERERHSFSGRTHCFVIELFMLSRPGHRGWKLIVAKEHWWDGDYKRVIKELHWARPCEGNRRDIMTWLRRQEIAAQGPVRLRVDHSPQAR